MNESAVAEAFRRWAEACPTPTTELHYCTPFQLLVAVVLSAQTTDQSVNHATRTLFTVAPDACAMAALDESEIISHIRRLGLYRTKARHLKALATQICRDYHGTVPNSRLLLERLPGVGRKTANVILNTLFDAETIAVDTHIFRIANRMGLAPGPTERAVEEHLLRRIPPPYRRHAHHWLILHGRFTCTARHPRCRHCLVIDLCTYPDKEKTHALSTLSR
ncbi:MAG: endonuclease III [Hydrogenophilus sp.]|nr:endonuclease III [Hydrogenophilus sp.]